MYKDLEKHKDAILGNAVINALAGNPTLLENQLLGCVDIDYIIICWFESNYFIQFEIWRKGIRNVLSNKYLLKDFIYIGLLLIFIEVIVVGLCSYRLHHIA